MQLNATENNTLKTSNQLFFLQFYNHDRIEVSNLNIVSIEDGFERVFWNTVNKDPLNYYFFILDWTRQRDQTKILLAMEDKRVIGSMLQYTPIGRRHSVVQLRGSRKAIEQLLSYADFERVQLQAPVDCEDIVLERCKPWFKHVLILMYMKKGEETLLLKKVPVKLGPEDIGDIVNVMQGADTEYWGDLDVEQQKLAWKDAYMLGIRQDNKLVSIGLTRFVDIGSNISAIATDKAYRNRGFATSVVSALADEILKRSPPALIHVLSDNASAMRIYSKVGFKPCKHYILIQA